jgi:uncharacterized membrane protein (Fun14 family)
MSVEHPSPLVTSIGFGRMAGFLVVYAIKKNLAVSVGIF